MKYDNFQSISMRLGEKGLSNMTEEYTCASGEISLLHFVTGISCME